MDDGAACDIAQALPSASFSLHLHVRLPYSRQSILYATQIMAKSPTTLSNRSFPPRRYPGFWVLAASRPAISHSACIRPQLHPIIARVLYVLYSGSSGYTSPSTLTPVEQRTHPVA